MLRLNDTVLVPADFRLNRDNELTAPTVESNINFVDFDLPKARRDALALPTRHLPKYEHLDKKHFPGA